MDLAVARACCTLLWAILPNVYSGSAAHAAVVAYLAPPASEIKRNADFTKVEVRSAGSGRWQEVAVYDHESSPFAEAMTLRNIDAIGFSSYRTGAAFSNLQFGSSAK